jgi:hypothetical protein
MKALSFKFRLLAIVFIVPFRSPLNLSAVSCRDWLNFNSIFSMPLSYKLTPTTNSLWKRCVGRSNWGSSRKADLELTRVNVTNKNTWKYSGNGTVVINHHLVPGYMG